jgi:ABC-type transport system involved in multi-copper enzyme maturation permease subunit
MTYTLIKKEFRQLLPISILLILFFTVQLVESPISGRLDEESWSSVTGYLMPGTQGFIGISLIIFCLMTAYALFPREHDDKTIEYLYSLPVSRKVVFLSKFSVALIILCGALLLGCITEWFLQLFNNQPYSGDQFDIKTAVTAYLLLSVFICVMLSYGVLLSFFRRFGLLLLGMVWVLISTFKDKLTFLEYLNIFQLVTMEYHGQTLLIPWKLLFINTGMGIISLIIAGFLWGAPAEQFSMWYHNFFKKRIGAIIGILSLIAIFIFFGCIFNSLMKDEVAKNYLKEQYVSFQTATFSTDHYQITYPQNLRETAYEIISRADEVYTKVREFISAKDSDAITVDLTEQSNEHAGIAALYKIRMDIGKTSKLEDRLRVFAHETTHVFAILESNKKMYDYSYSTHFFSEGLADYVSYVLFPDSEKLDAQNLMAVASWKRFKITFDDMADMTSFKKRYSEHLFYALGHLWVKAISDTYGDKAVSDILRSLGRKGAPTNLSSNLLWQDTLQAMNCDQEKVNMAWLKLLTDLSVKYDKKIEALPRIRGGVVDKDKGEIILSAVPDRDTQSQDLIYVVRYRKNSEVEEDDTYMIFGEIQPDKKPLEIRFRIPSGNLVGRRFEYQFGYIFNKETFPYFEEWQSGENK